MNDSERADMKARIDEYDAAKKLVTKYEKFKDLVLGEGDAQFLAFNIHPDANGCEEFVAYSAGLSCSGKCANDKDWIRVSWFNSECEGNLMADMRQAIMNVLHNYAADARNRMVDV